MKMLALLSVCCAMALCYGVFLLKQDVMKLERQHRSLQNEIAAAKQSIHVLNAEWAYLTRPDYIRQLAAVYLDGAPLSSAQVVRLEDVAPAPVMATATPAPTYIAAVR